MHDSHHADELKATVESLKKEISELKELLADVVFIISVMSTEVIQQTENSSKALHGEVPAGCRSAHYRLREHIVQISSKWNRDRTADLKKHLFGHD